MKTNTLLALALSLASLTLPQSLPAQGPLTPPGAPAPTMKTLDQIDARTPISSAPFTINTAGSYYLTGNLSVAAGDAITINADHVTLDLNGFTIASTHPAGNGTAVRINGIRKNVTIRNGYIRGATTFAAGGFLDGVANSSATSTNLRISDLNIHGMAFNGIQLGTTSVPTFIVERCTVTTCLGRGIMAARVHDCAVDTAGDNAILVDNATHCSGKTVNSSAVGVYGESIVENCQGTAVGGAGVQSGAIVSNSRATAASGTGLSATNASNCSGISSAGTGLIARSASNCFGCTSSGPAGLDANPGTASFCRGQHAGGLVAITATNAVAGTVQTGTVTATTKSLGTP